METINTVVTVLETLGVYVLITTIYYIYKLFSANEIIRKFYKRKVIRNAVLIITLLFLFAGGALVLTRTTGVDINSGGPQTAYFKSSPFSGFFDTNSDSGFSMACPPGYSFIGGSCTTGSNSITDTREFLKKSFSAMIETRHVTDVATKTEALIKSSGGRIDNSNVGTTYANFLFVIPKSSLDSFQTELQTFTNKKLYTQSVSTQNLLTEKQNLEGKQQTNATTTTQLTQQKQKAQTDYTKTSKDLNAQIATLQSKLNSIATALANTTDEQTKVALQQQQSQAAGQLQTVQQRLDQATTNFKTTMTNLGVSLDEQSRILLNLNDQESQFFDKIDAVEGHITITHISLWQLLNALSPINPIFILGALLAVLRFFSLKKRERALLVTTPEPNRGQFPEKYQ